jgi:hypothetical protein
VVHLFEGSDSLLEIGLVALDVILREVVKRRMDERDLLLPQVPFCTAW